MEVRRLWQAEVEVVPIILRVLGVIPKDLWRNLEKIRCIKLARDLLQKSVMLATAYNYNESTGFLRRVVRIESLGGRLHPGSKPKNTSPSNLRLWEEEKKIKKINKK